MGRTRTTGPKRALTFNEPPEPGELEVHDLDARPTDADEDSFPDSDNEDEDEGEDVPDYDEAADEAAAPFKKDDDPEYQEREAAICVYMKELRFNRSVSLRLYRDQGLYSAQSLLRLKDESIDKMMSAIRKEDTTIHIPITAVENFKLLIYYLKHRQRTSRPYMNIWAITMEHLDRLSHHRDVEAMWDKKNKPPETVIMTIDQGCREVPHGHDRNP
jgi:hypothetical protein